MLCYLGTGPRDYARKPHPVSQRRYWEFQAVVSGAIAMVLPEGPEPLRSRRLWVSAPGHLHGWIGERGRPAEVTVFQYMSVPELVLQRFQTRKCAEISLTSENVARLKQLARDVEATWNTPHPENLLRHEHLLLELSLLVCGSGSNQAQSDADRKSRVVHAALQWFHEHMPENPGLGEIAQAAGASPAHLRRLFHDVMKESPKKILDQIRFRRAMHLMADPETKLSTVGETCGFESASSFSRAFKAKFGCSPEKWRS